MFEKPLTGENHGHVLLVAGLDDLVVTFRSAWLDHAPGAFLYGGIHTVPEGEKPSETITEP